VGKLTFKVQSCVLINCRELYKPPVSSSDAPDDVRSIVASTMHRAPEESRWSDTSNEFIFHRVAVGAWRMVLARRAAEGAVEAAVTRWTRRTVLIDGRCSMDEAGH
jgi:hypothetical protein